MVSTDTAIVHDWHDLCREAALKLDRNMRDGYTDGYESTLAAEVIAKTTGDDEAMALARQLMWERINADLGLSLLDETDSVTYTVVERITGVLMEEIAQQGALQHALEHLVTDEITELQKSMHEPVAAGGATA